MANESNTNLSSLHYRREFALPAMHFNDAVYEHLMVAAVPGEPCQLDVSRLYDGLDRTTATALLADVHGHDFRVELEIYFSLREGQQHFADDGSLRPVPWGRMWLADDLELAKVLDHLHGKNLSLLRPFRHVRATTEAVAAYLAQEFLNVSMRETAMVKLATLVQCKVELHETPCISAEASAYRYFD